jgi:hypothetical protein
MLDERDSADPELSNFERGSVGQRRETSSEHGKDESKLSAQWETTFAVEIRSGAILGSETWFF